MRIFSQRRLSAAILFAGLASMMSCNSNHLVTVHPVQTDSFLLNPGRGFTSTGDRYNSTIDEQKHPLCGVVQQRYFWEVLEPKEGQFNFAVIDSAIVNAVRNGQRLNFRVMCQDVDMKLPRWAIAAGVKSPYYDNPVFIEKQTNLIKALARRYDGHPGVCFVDIGSIGQWGEWHIDPDAPDPTKIQFPTEANAEKIIDAYVNNFHKTPLAALISFKQKHGFAYAISKGAGWRADCWGDMDSLGWNHMKGVYPQALQQANAFEAWKKAPVALETCWTMQEWFDKGWDIDYILERALSWHATEVNNGTQPIPQPWLAKVRAFEKKLGYRFALKTITYPSSVSRSKHIDFSTEWENAGVAPVYAYYPVALRFTSSSQRDTAFTVLTGLDPRDWMPGTTQSSFQIHLPAKAKPGTYDLQIALVSPENTQPAIQLAIKGGNEQRWYAVGQLTVTN